MISSCFVVYGIGMGIVSPTIYDRAVRLPPDELTGSVVAIFNTMKYAGMTLSPAVLGLMLAFAPLDKIFAWVGAAAAPFLLRAEGR